MPSCDLCGKQENLFIANVESVEMTVCSSCSSFGIIIKPIKKIITPKKTEKKKNEAVEYIIEDSNQKIRIIREKSGLNQEDFAKKLSIRTSLLQKIETNNTSLDIPLARKLEKLLHINLIEQKLEESSVEIKNNKSSDTMTVGDVVKL